MRLSRKSCVLAFAVVFAVLGTNTGALAQDESENPAPLESVRAPDPGGGEFKPPASAFDTGGFAPEDPWLSDLADSRKAYGLPSDKKLVAELMVSPEAQRQVSTYGVVLTLTEEKAFATKAAAIDDYTKAMTIAEDLPSYAGAIVQDDKEPYTLRVFVGGTDKTIDEGTARLRSVANGLNGPIDISIEEREFSIADLAAIGSILNGNDATSRFSKGQIGALAKVVASQDLPDGTLFGYSMRHGTLTAQLPIGVRGDSYKNFSLGTDLPDVRIVSTKSSGDDWGPADQGAAACGRFWCGAPKGGHIVRFKVGSNYFLCSWAAGLRVKPNGTSVWKTNLQTAGHCGDTSHDEIYYNYQNEGQSKTPSTHFGIVNTTAPNDTIGTEWRNSTERAGDAWGDYSLVSASATYTSNLILTGNTTTARVTVLTPVAADLDVCISARSTGVKCDEVDDIGWVKDFDGKQVTHLAITRGSYDAVGGDSGATMFVQGVPSHLAGSHSGWKTNWLGLKYQLFSRVTLIDNSPNMNITSVIPVATDGRRDFIAGLYTRSLNRLPDNGGYNYWRYNVMSTCNLANAKVTAESFLLGQEFKNRFPVTFGTVAQKKENAKLRVYYAYRTFFGRDPDSSGLNWWYGHVMVNGINSGNPEGAWGTVVWSFSNSGEFANRVSGPTALADGAICG